MQGVSKQTTVQNEMFKIGDLGSFSMKEIYDALTNSGRLAGVECDQTMVPYKDNQGDDSDCSWTYEEDSGEFYRDIRQRLDSFILNADQTTMTTEALNRRQRRFVHATAQVMRLGHASLGPSGKNRSMVIYKDESASRLVANQRVEQNTIETHQEEVDFGVLPPVEPAPRKRRRLHKMDRGFPCRYTSCKKVYDRASERTKHEQSHQIAYTNRFQCIHCEKGFRYPKDLRRHQKIHESIMDGDSTLLSTSFDSTRITSNLTNDSRVPSDTSLNFCSKPTSQDNSPLMAPFTGKCGTVLGIEPFVLDETAWLPSSACVDDNFQLPFEELACFAFDDQNGDDDFLELARVRK